VGKEGAESVSGESGGRSIGEGGGGGVFVSGE
jgi:hypothetical protein